MFKQENVQILAQINNFMIHKNYFANNAIIMMEYAKAHVLLVFTLTILFNVNSVTHNVNHVKGLIVINVLDVTFHFIYRMTTLVLYAYQDNSQINNKIFVKCVILDAYPVLDRIQTTVYLAYNIKFYQKTIMNAQLNLKFKVKLKMNQRQNILIVTKQALIALLFLLYKNLFKKFLQECLQLPLSPSFYFQFFLVQMDYQAGTVFRYFS
ncbi:transmembrane protein, putative (macronuclear) [Tetrahymena thermophila SB210]|uniref:Transmembrane protein, putative n=1 Tax=Tetrahymena thermophila (strain SB210) TaxID=312017 RepID=W7X6E6_TETTS|nr:transmembrane protein, putative [Tetrahymena thermophila SB210]EWS74955.1 transmembrane protein, putative [Tetrahymena thermophila SB210]|eukprot:XP_012652496.1 transmembrane protein, putative [Tetrahymena thermophila SB210]